MSTLKIIKVERGVTPNENQISDGYRERAPIEVEVF